VGGFQGFANFLSLTVMTAHNHYNKRLKQYARELRSESVSPAEKLIWKALLRNTQTGFKFLRQRPIDNFIVDFFCPDLKLIIEIDGNSHYNKGEYDRYRQDKLISLGYHMLRFEEAAVINQLNNVAEQINHAVFVLKDK
jgi:very-short-patch-repair endonuclease